MRGTWCCIGIVGCVNLDNYSCGKTWLLNTVLWQGEGGNKWFSCSISLPLAPQGPKCPVSFPLREVSRQPLSLKLYLPTSKVSPKWSGIIVTSIIYRDIRTLGGHLVQPYLTWESPLYNLPKCHPNHRHIQAREAHHIPRQLILFFFRALLGNFPKLR